MEPILTLGIIIFTGFVAGELCSRIGLPKVTGYVLAGMLLNPNLSPIIPASFVEQTGLVTSISLAFITFSVGGTLLFPRIRALGKPIVLITLFEAEFAFLFVAALVIFLGPTFIEIPGATRISFFLPLALLLGALASPTDPSATLAVEHEFQARGEVTSTIMGVAAFDDILGIINYSLAVSVAGIFILDEPLGSNVVVHPLLKILGSIGLGILFGLILNGLLKIIKKETESVLITVIISLLSLCYGLAGLAGADELLSTMTMGVIVVNYSYKKEKVFNILERYTEELIFVLFFTLSAMHLDFSVMGTQALLIVLFILFRALGKLSGTLLGGEISGAPAPVKKYAAGGLIPQGGIVIGLALVIRQNGAFEAISDIILNVVIGATIIHEIIGPIISRVALKKAGEIE